MGMTIEELVETAQKYNCMIVTKEMWNTALGNSHKLQKIEQIFKDIEECPLVEDYALDEIRGILEDGKID